MFYQNHIILLICDGYPLFCIIETEDSAVDSELFPSELNLALWGEEEGKRE